MRVNSALGQIGLSQVGPGQLGLVPYIKPGGNVFNKRIYIQKVGGGMSDTKKHNFMRSLIHFLYRTRDTRYQLMSADRTNHPFFKQLTPFMLISLIRLLIVNTGFTN